MGQLQAYLTPPRHGECTRTSAMPCTGISCHGTNPLTREGALRKMALWRAAG